jgi:hypothetical protein
MSAAARQAKFFSAGSERFLIVSGVEAAIIKA